MNTAGNKDLGEILRQARVRIPLTLQGLAAMAGVSPSHLGRIERGDRFPSAGVLKRIAKPLGFGEAEIFTLAGYLSPRANTIPEAQPSYSGGQMDPYVAKILAQEPREIQYSIIGILGILKAIAKTMVKEKEKPER